MEQRKEISHALGLDKPAFYFSVRTLSDCDTLYKIPDPFVRQNLHYLSRQYGNWPLVQSYYRSLIDAINGLTLEQKETHIQELTEARSVYLSLLSKSNNDQIEILFDKQSGIIAGQNNASLTKQLKVCRNAYKRMTTETSRWKRFVPAFSWNGMSNQYHEWIFGSQTIGYASSKGLIGGDFGRSIEDQREISTNLIRKFRLSFELVIISIILAYLVSIPIGVFAAFKRNTLLDKGSGIILFMLYAIPNFFVGLLLIQFFANPEHYEWFEGAGYKNPNVSSETYYGIWKYADRLEHSLPYMILPIFTYVYAQFAFISRLTRSALIDQLNQGYIVTARAKGLSEWKTITRHALRNSWLPIITVFSNIFPMAVGGSVIIETIFDYEGLGKEMYEAILSNDFMIVINIFTLSAFLTMAGYLLADILYKLSDPRIRFSKNW